MAGSKHSGGATPKLSKRFLAYALLCFVLPGITHMIFGPLPFVHHTGFAGRLAIAGLIGLLVFGAEFSRLKRVVAGDTPASGDPTGDPIGQLKRAVTALLGACLFVWVSADFSANIFGAVSHALPRKPYQDEVRVERAWVDEWQGRSGGPRQWLRLEMRSNAADMTQYVVLSPRLMVVPYLQAGDTARLYGWQTLLGAYVTRIEVVPVRGRSENEEES